ncbi:MAG: GNAT family N-acetyltransferase [Proteobacteria bacterium]|nr:GNAT family N-acetyltransferase [Pseudomonadota bacterium]
MLPQVVLDHIDQRMFAEKYTIQPLHLEDEAEIVQLIRQSLLSYPDEGMILASTRRRLAHFYSSYQDDGASYLVLRDRSLGRVIGGVGIRSFAGLDAREHIGELRELVLAQDYRGLGLGQQILEASIQKAHQLEYQRLYLEATSEMRHAQNLFRRCGFRAVEFHRKGTVAESTESFPSYFVLEPLTLPSHKHSYGDQK